MSLQGLHAQRCSYRFYSISMGDCHHRCIPYRLGCSVAEQDRPWAVACGGLSCTHQCAGAAWSPPGSQALLATPEGQACLCAVRQHIGVVSHKPSGWHKVCTAAGSDEGAPYLGSTHPPPPPSSFTQLTFNMVAENVSEPLEFIIG